MPLYEYEDKEDGERVIVSTQADKGYMDSLVEKGIYRRIFGFSIAKSFTGVNPHDPRQPPITSRTRYKDELAILSEQHSARHGGMDVNYQPVDIADPREVGVSEAGIEVAERRKRDGVA